MGEEDKYKIWAGPTDVRVSGESLGRLSKGDWLTNGGDDNMKLYKYVILDRSTGITTGSGWVVGEDREQAMAAVPTHDHSLDKIKVFLKEFGSYEPIE